MVDMGVDTMLNVIKFGLTVKTESAGDSLLVIFLLNSSKFLMSSSYIFFKFIMCCFFNAMPRLAHDTVRATTELALWSSFVYSSLTFPLWAIL